MWSHGMDDGKEPPAPESEGKSGEGKGGKVEGGKGKSGKEGKKASVKDDSSLLPSEALKAASEAERASAAASEKRLSSRAGDEQFERRLGRALLENQQKMGGGGGGSSVELGKKAMAALMKAWDTNGDGELSKMELRQAIRGKKEGELGLKATNQEIDQLFDDFDSDGGGTLDLKELRPCLKALVDAATAAEAEAEALKGMAALSLTRSEELADAAAAMQEVEAEEGRLHEVSLTLPIGVRLMGALMKKGVVRLEDMGARFKANEKGNIGRKQFVKAVLDENIERATVEEVEAWYDERVQAESAEGIGGGAAAINLQVTLKVARQASVKAKEAEVRQNLGIDLTLFADHAACIAACAACLHCCSPWCLPWCLLAVLATGAASTRLIPVCMSACTAVDPTATGRPQEGAQKPPEDGKGTAAGNPGAASEAGTRGEGQGVGGEGGGKGAGGGRGRGEGSKGAGEAGEAGGEEGGGGGV